MAVTAAGCTSSNSSSSGAASGGSGSGLSAAAPAGPAAPEAGGASAAASAADGGVAAGSSSGSGSAAGSSGSRAAAGSVKLVAGGQSLIYTARLSVRASSVRDAVTRATSIVTAAGGYVAEETTDTPPDGHGQGSATVELKIPVAAYQPALAQLSGGGLGTRLSLSQQAQDVTQQVADVNSRVASDRAAIAQLRELLKRAGTVSELLTVQNQIDAEQSDLESMLAQQRVLSRETSYGTVTLTLTGPKAAAKPRPAAPPPGLASGASSGWHAFTVTIGWLLTALGAVAPFAAALLVIGAAAWWLRRRGRRGGRGGRVSEQPGD